MSSTLTVRRIAADQGSVYRELRAASLREPYAPGEAPEAELSVDADAADAIAAQRASSDQSTTFLLYTEGHPAGMIGAYLDNSPERRAFVSELWVAHAVRHLRGGVLPTPRATGWPGRAPPRSTHGSPSRTATRSASTSTWASPISASMRRSPAYRAR